jgi:putative flippase GtrA
MQSTMRFGYSGIAATLTHMLLAYVLIVQLGADAAIGNVLAFCGATLLSYQLNTQWSFRCSHSPTRLGRFILVATAGSLLCGLIAGLAERAAVPWWMGVGIVVMTVSPITYCAHRFWTYR